MWPRSLFTSWVSLAFSFCVGLLCHTLLVNSLSGIAKNLSKAILLLHITEQVTLFVKAGEVVVRYLWNVGILYLEDFILLWGYQADNMLANFSPRTAVSLFLGHAIFCQMHLGNPSMLFLLFHAFVRLTENGSGSYLM